MCSDIKKGKVYIASMNMRGKHAIKPTSDTLKINVTSFQRLLSKYRLAFSPMTYIKNGYKGFYNFEHRWQSIKVYEDDLKNMSKHEDKIKWWKKQIKPHRRYPKSKGKKVVYALDNSKKYDYVSSKKKIYVPEYTNLVKNNEVLFELKKLLNNGTDIAIYDFDGPRDKINKEPLCLEVTKELLTEKINDTQYLFGYRYIITSLLLDLDISHFC